MRWRTPVPRGKALVDLDQHPRPAALDRLHAFSP
jgi:hypothetical protein